MAEQLPIVRFKALIDNLANRIKTLQLAVVEAGGFVGLSPDLKNALRLDSDGTLLYVERTGEELIALIDSIENTNFLTDAERLTIEQIGGGEINLTTLIQQLQSLQDAVKTTIDLGEIGTISVDDAFNDQANITTLTIKPTGYTLIRATREDNDLEWLFTGSAGEYGVDGKLAFPRDFFSGSGVEQFIGVTPTLDIVAKKGSVSTVDLTSPRFIATGKTNNDILLGAGGTTDISLFAKQIDFNAHIEDLNNPHIVQSLQIPDGANLTLLFENSLL